MRDENEVAEDMKGSIQDISTMHDVLHESMTGLWIIELEDGRPPRMFADQTMMELLGLKEETTPEQCYDHWYGKIEKEYYPVVNACVEEMTRKGRAEVQYPWYHPKLGKIYVRCGGVADQSYAHMIRLRGYHQNVTDTTVMRREKEKLEELNQEIIGSLYNLFFAVYRIDMEKGTICAIRIPGDVHKLPRKEFSYESFWEDYASQTFHPDYLEEIKKELSIAHFRELIAEGNERYSVESLRKVEGEYHFISCNVYLGGKKGWALLALQDLHEQKKKDEESKKALKEAYEMAQKANEAKSDFLSKMSHDIRTPLNAVLGMTELARLHMDDREKLVNALDKITSSSQLLLGLVNEVLDMSRIESGNYELQDGRFDLDCLIEELIGLIMPQAEARRQRIHLDKDGITHVKVIGDNSRINQIFMNIMSNACKYTPEGGDIYISVSELPSGNKEVGRYRFVFRDTGIGMSEDFLRHIFEPFSRANDSRISKISGTGLGMVITQNLVQMMGGEITVNSRLGEGSCFTVVIGLKLQTDEREEEILPDIREVDCSGARILLAEDNEINREIAAELLQMTGAAVDSARNGQEALDKFREAGEGYYQLIFMDIQMPVMNGYDCVKAIRDLDRPDAGSIPIIAMTANAFAENVIMSAQAGMNEHLAKPIKSSQLAEILQKWILSKS